MTTAPSTERQSSRAFPWRHLAAAVAFGLAALVVWAVAYGTERGLRFDVEAAHGLDTPGYDLDFFLFSVRVVIPLTIVAIVAMALRGQRRHALAAATILVGGSVSCVALKIVLGRLDPFHGDAARGIGEFFPSVHTGAATSAALALTLLARGRLRTPAAFAAAAYAAAVGAASIVAGGHFPSDVLGAFLVAVAWGSVGAGVLSFVGSSPRPNDEPGTCAPWLLGAAVGGALAVVLLGFIVDEDWARDNGSSLLALASFALVAPLLVAAFVVELDAAEEPT